MVVWPFGFRELARCNWCQLGPCASGKEYGWQFTMFLYLAELQSCISFTPVVLTDVCMLLTYPMQFILVLERSIMFTLSVKSIVLAVSPHTTSIVDFAYPQ